MNVLNRRKILRLALPAMVENLLQMLMGFVDNFLVAQISLIAVSGVAIANNVITVYQALFIALSSAISSLLARSIGQKNETKEIEYMAKAIMVTLLLSLFLGLFNLFLGSFILRLLGAHGDLVKIGYDYLSVVGGMILSLGLLTSLGTIVRVRGMSKLPMYVSFLTNLLNAILSSLSIYIFHFGIMGVAWSTVLSRLIGIVILASFLPIKRIIKSMTFEIDWEMFSLALPAAGERLMMRLGDLLILMIVVRFGTAVLAGNAIGETISQFNYMPGMAVATASVILVANLVGSQKEGQIHVFIRDAFMLSTLLMVVFSFLVFLFAPLLIPLFTVNYKAYKAAEVVLLFSLLSAPATSGILVYTALWQGLGNAKLPFYATSIGMWFIRIIAGYLLGVQFKLGLEGVWLATALDNLTRWLILKKVYDKRKRVSL
ncbi:MATE family efflux transporter [Streptococcus pseudoporcinus]|uniref:Probable multidrug resistance protein NorM n=1 Tax=Streptococcus pseudoporcinus TaxID=361101 RepID=A0A4U9XH54_9STRE|nr:MATE family efflux transporter [Streptococcus pseudoporcinus]VTS12279.1 multi antimicrobial extrusion (MATE) family transporter [Streptococcus pseudoporcinus]VUC64805.1 multi antimicrobial extrusion (MATE) family transporter [Streptococcus pseudoporcinus]VUC95279.1 multi antimicrobial extrusion (MATE) family transporter [Streptococcus pseudoporcinus]VUC95512.1 multi antimicrobial extrusion (MATE) family transporter [Streptococcus pseudoporcinus]